MKIIKPGKLPVQEEMYQVTCPACGCEFEFTRSESRAGMTNPTQGYQRYFKVDCPTCKRGVYKYFNSDLTNEFIK